MRRGEPVRQFRLLVGLLQCQMGEAVLGGRETGQPPREFLDLLRRAHLAAEQRGGEVAQGSGHADQNTTV